MAEKNEPEKDERDLSALGGPAPESPDIDEIVALARRYYASGFPNPQRRGCPPPGEIVKVVSRRRAPGQALREHLFECSECFGEYRQALAQPRNEVAGWEWSISIHSFKRVSIPAVILLSLVFAGILIWRKPTPDAPHEQITSSNPNNAAIATPTATPNRTAAPLTADIVALAVKRPELGGKSRSSGRLEPGFETIPPVDLDNYPVFRRLGEDLPPIELPAIRAHLVLHLPETGTAGKYRVSLIDAFGRALVSETAVSSDGVKLHVKLDLRRVTPKKYRLCLSRKYEAPAYYDAVVRRR